MASVGGGGGGSTTTSSSSRKYWLEVRKLQYHLRKLRDKFATMEECRIAKTC